MHTKLMKTIIALLFLFFVSCSQVNDRNSDMEKIGPDVPASLVVYFKLGTTEEQIEHFYRNYLYVPRPDGRGENHKYHIRMVLRLLPSQANNHDAVAVTFDDNASEEQRRNAKESFESSEIVFKVFENIAPKDIKI